MARERSLNAEWIQFRMLDIAHNAPPVQIREMQKAFYAGCASMLDLCSGATLRLNAEQRGLLYKAFLDEIESYLADFNRSAPQHSGDGG